VAQSRADAQKDRTFCGACSVASVTGRRWRSWPSIEEYHGADRRGHCRRQRGVERLSPPFIVDASMSTLKNAGPRFEPRPASASCRFEGLGRELVRRFTTHSCA
jgi:hypothetical protein